jgi:hypothetical protein
MTTIQKYVQQMQSGMVGIYISFIKAFKKRGVKNQPSIADKTQLKIGDFMEKNNTFVFTSFLKEGTYEASIVFFPETIAMLKFQWIISEKNGSNKRYNSKSFYFNTRKLSQKDVLDLVASFLKGKIKPDIDSRKKFVEQINEIAVSERTKRFFRSPN